MSTQSTRRGILGAGAALLAVGGTAAASTITRDDTELLRLAAEFDRMAARYWALNAKWGDVIRIPAAVEAELAATTVPQGDLAERIAELHAHTPAGLRAKARVLLFYSGYTWEGEPDWTNHDELLGWSLARDLCGDDAARPAGGRA